VYAIGELPDNLTNRNSVSDSVAVYDNDPDEDVDEDV
jgi:hypothetical protein